MAIEQGSDGYWRNTNDDSSPGYATREQAEAGSNILPSGGGGGDASLDLINNMMAQGRRDQAERNRAIQRENQRQAAEDAKIEATRKMLEKERKTVLRRAGKLHADGKIDEAINCCKNFNEWLDKNEYQSFLEIKDLGDYISLMYYKQGKYKEAMGYKCDVIDSLCHTQLGAYQEATKSLRAAMCNKCNPFFTLNNDRMLLNAFKYLSFDISIKELFPLVEKRVDEGNADFFRFMGDFYRCGVCVDKNENKSKEWYEKAMKSNDRDAFYTVALLSLKGDGGYAKSKKNHDKYLKKAASLGHKEAKEEWSIVRMENFGFLGYRNREDHGLGFPIIFAIIIFTVSLLILSLVKAMYPSDNFATINVVIYFIVSLIICIFAGICIKWRHAVFITVFCLLIVMLVFGIRNYAVTEVSFFPAPITNKISKITGLPNMEELKAVNEANKHRVITKDTKMQSAPSPYADTVKNLKKGDVVYVIKSASSSYTHIKHDNDEGYVEKIFIGKKEE